jgi:type II secretory pathway component GspD/PulD (secretin)
VQKRFIAFTVFVFIVSFSLDIRQLSASVTNGDVYEMAFFGKKSKDIDNTKQEKTAPQQSESEKPVPFWPTLPKSQQPVTQPEPQMQLQPEQQQPAVQPQPDQSPQPQQQEPQKQPGEQETQPQIKTQQPPAGISKASLKKGEVSFNFDDADVFSVIQTIFGDVMKVNYVVDPRVKGRVNFRSVAPVAKEDVLSLMEVILRLNGVGIVEEGGLYRIIPISDLAKEPASVGIGRETEVIQTTGKAILQIVPLKYIPSTEMIRILTPFLSLNAVVIDVPKSNHIVIVDTDANVKRLVQLVGIFDNENLKQTKPQVFVYSVQNSKAKDIASLLQQIFLGTQTTTQTTTPAKTAQPKALTPQQPQTVQQSAPQTPYASGVTGGESMVSEHTRIIPDEITNTIVILGSPEDYAIILAALQQIDIVPRQVMIEAIVAEVKLTDNLRFGLQWLIQNDVKLQIEPFTNDINLDGPLAFKSLIDGATLTYTALDLAGNTKLLIQALADDNKAKILSSPHILVSDNREARIQVGDQIPISTSTTSTPIGGTIPTNTTTSTIQYKDTGTILKVKPQVNDSGLVALEISQEVSKANIVNVLGTQQYQITKRDISTNLVAQDGQTIVLGGLIDETTSKGRSGIPFLSKIPILGYLFGSTIDDTTRTELIILLTPHVIRNQQEAGNTSSDYLDRFKENTKMKMDELKNDKVKKEQGDGNTGNKDSRQDNP